MTRGTSNGESVNLVMEARKRSQSFSSENEKFLIGSLAMVGGTLMCANWETRRVDPIKERATGIDARAVYLIVPIPLSDFGVMPATLNMLL